LRTASIAEARELLTQVERFTDWVETEFVRP
jgi:hypothetical protein